jgi:pimeloyl-ACP methyl ester carboxylesterase
MIAIHGSGHTHDSYAAQVAAFSGFDAVSLPGHPEGSPLHSVGDCATWLAKYLRWQGDGKAIVLGNSLGGAVALEWALRYPADVAGLVLIGTGARLRVSPAIFDAIENDWPACVDMLVGYEIAVDAPAGLRARAVDWHHVVGQPNTLADFRMCDAFDVMDRVSSVEAPTLIVVGERDQMTPLKYSQFLNQQIAGSELNVIEGAGHMAHAEKPDAVNDLIVRKFGATAR